MKERNRSDSCSNPLATVEDIQRRLLRPSSLPSPPPKSTIKSSNAVRCRDSSQFKSNLVEFQTNKEQANARELMNDKKLEDYLDPHLLSAISSQIGRKKKNPDHTKRNLIKQVKEFEWPVDQLKVFMEDSRSTEKRDDDWKGKEVVNLNDDSDPIKNVEVAVEDDESCTPFWRFENTTLKLFKA